ncbi:universal stress protein [Ideonella sp. BN130291]|uniref:universal stress protein n=1 Tax=Ideonella sp. BN130291 TaxID=3112940 RepID=UPI002E2770A5|nr:universal stress protein [Ideonella sp. BN130291]
MKILLAVDGSTYTRHMLGYLAAHDELLGADRQYTAFTVVPPIPPHATSFLEREVIDTYYREQAQQVLAPVQSFARQNGWEMDARHAVGHAGDAIASLATEGRFDLIVMGTHGHSALANAVMGSVATRVIAQGKVPVLLIR